MQDNILSTDGKKILHFHSYNHIGLTIASKRLDNSNYYVLGMSLAHKNDNGSRFVGRNYALEALNEGLNDTDLELHLNSMRDSMVSGVLTRSTEKPTIVFGQKEHYIVFGLATIKAIVGYLRDVEWYSGDSKVNSVYHKAFFNLPELYKKI